MAGFFPNKKQLSQHVEQFLQEIEDDFGGPYTSKFQDYIPKCRTNVTSMEESLAGDKTHVHKLCSALKELSKVGEQHGQCMATLADHLVQFGTHINTTDPTLGNSFVKFGTLMNQTASLLSNMATSTRNIIFFSLSMLFDNEMKNNRYKSDVKSLIGQYQSARNQVEKEEKKTLVAAGCNVTDRAFTAEELSGKLIMERRRFQLGVCEYMLKFNDVKTKEGVDLAEHLIGFYHAQETYFKDSSMLLAALKSWEERFSTQVTGLRSQQDEERKKLQVARDKLRAAMGIGSKIQAPTHLDPSSSTSLTEKQGYLGKRPENALRITRNRWPKRWGAVSMQGFTLGQSHNHAPHVKIPPMHFQFKDCVEPIDGRKYCFKLIAHTKTYTFDAESEKELKEWRETMQNVQLKLFAGDGETTLQRQRSTHNPLRAANARERKELVKRIVTRICSLPGNDKCCDCNAPDPKWLSVNLGILMCIHCSGRHRELSVQYSRIRSLTLDTLKTPELLIALVMGNGLLNEVLEANLTDTKPVHDTPTEVRHEFITNKYIHRSYIENSVGKDALLQELFEAVDSRDIKQLLQVYAEGVDLSAPLPGYPGGFTALHLAIELEDLTSLHIVDFLLGNGRTENCKDSEGNTPLHLAVTNDHTHCVKILLVHGADLKIENSAGQTPVDIARENSYEECLELLQDAEKKKFAKCEHIDIDWGVDAEEEEIYQIPLLPQTSSSSTAPGPAPIKRSDTTGNIAENPKSPPVVHKSPSSSIILDSTPRKRPMSQFFDRSPKTPHSDSTRSRVAFAPTQPNVHPAPTFTAPPPPPRTVSKTAEALPEPSSRPVPPKREKKMKRVSMFPDMSELNRGENPNQQALSLTLSSPPSTTPHGPQFTPIVVEAQFDCEPDRKDELGFKEGEKIVVTRKLNSDWWRGYVESDKTREGVFPVNYVQICTTTGTTSLNL